MPDPILDEIWRVRELLVKQHGGIDGSLKYVEKVDRAHRQRRRRARSAKPR
jgi:hypothetical protein